MRRIWLGVAWLLWGAGAWAQSTTAEVAQKPGPENLPVFTVFPKLGAAFPQVLSPLTTAPAEALELGWVTPILNHQLAVEVELSYSQPNRHDTITDPRLSGGSATYTLIERELGLFLGPKYYLFPLSESLLPFAALGVRVQFLGSRIRGASAAEFGTYVESGAPLAFAAQAGVGYKLGPGHLALELQFTSTPIKQLVTGQVDVGDIAVRAGYLLHF